MLLEHVLIQTLRCSWIESDRDESEDVGRIEEAFDDATDGIRGTLAKGYAFLLVALNLLPAICACPKCVSISPLADLT